MPPPNLVNVATITAKTAALAITSAATAIVSITSGSGKVGKINSLIIANIDGSSSADVTVDLYRSSTAYPLFKTNPVDADESVIAIDKDTGIYLEEGDTLRLTASADGDLVGTCLYEELS